MLFQTCMTFSFCDTKYDIFFSPHNESQRDPVLFSSTIIFIILDKNSSKYLLSSTEESHAGLELNQCKILTSWGKKNLLEKVTECVNMKLYKKISTLTIIKKKIFEHQIKIM